MRLRSTGDNSTIEPLVVPQLSLRGPIFGAVAAIVMVLLSGIATASYFGAAQFAAVDGNLIVNDAVTIVRAPLAGRAIEYYVADGDMVKKGQLLARLDNSELDKKIMTLTSQAAATRWRLRTIRAKIAKALKAPVRRMSVTKNEIARLTAQTSKVERMAQRLLQQVVAAERATLKAEVYASVSGRVEMIQRAKGLAQTNGEQEILRLVTTSPRLAVKTILPAVVAQEVKLGQGARIVMHDAQGRKYGPFAGRLRLVIRQRRRATGRGGNLRYAMFEFDRPRWQIAKHIAVRSGLKAEVLLEMGRRSIFRQLLTLPL